MLKARAVLCGGELLVERVVMIEESCDDWGKLFIYMLSCFYVHR